MSGGVPAGWVLVPVEPTEAMLLAGSIEVAGVQSPIEPYIADARNAWSAMIAATPTRPPSRDADVERDVRLILQAVADAHSEDCIGSIDVDIPKGGYPRQWLREAVHAALQALGERG